MRDTTREVPQRLHFLCLTQRLLRLLALGDFARERDNSALSFDDSRPQNHLVPMQAAILVAAVPIEAHRLTALRFLQPLRSLFGAVRMDTRADRGHVDALQFIV